MQLLRDHSWLLDGETDSPDGTKWTHLWHASLDPPDSTPRFGDFCRAHDRDRPTDHNSTYVVLCCGLITDHMNAATNVQAACVVQRILSSDHFMAECYLMQPNLLFILPVPANAAKQIAATTHFSSTITAPSYQYSPSIDYSVWCCYHILSAGVSVSV